MAPATVNGEDPEKHGQQQPGKARWRRLFKAPDKDRDDSSEENADYRPARTMGILSDRYTDEVPGTVLLLASNRNEPLGLRHQPHRTSASSLPTSYPPSRSSSRAAVATKKKTPDGQIVLDPQPDDSMNDPLNWPVWRRDAALVSLGFYCLMGGGMTTILAAGFNQVAQTYDVTTQKVAFTTGLYMMGLGVGSVIMSPTAILFGKRPVYLLGAALFVLSGIWCALSPNYPSLVVARVFQGIAVSPVECLPSATIAEIFFLHERAYRVGIYTLLLLGGKNLVPLVSAVIIGSKGWRWVFWVVAIVVGACWILLYFFVPETFWDRAPRPRAVSHQKRPNLYRSVSDMVHHGFRGRLPHVLHAGEEHHPPTQHPEQPPHAEVADFATPKKHKDAHVGFADGREENGQEEASREAEKSENEEQDGIAPLPHIVPKSHVMLDAPNVDGEKPDASPHVSAPAAVHPSNHNPAVDLEAARRVTSPTRSSMSLDPAPISGQLQYTNRLREQSQISFTSYLKLWNGRISDDQWLRVAARPFILFCYPAVLWSAVVYALSVGWLIVLSESVAYVFEDKTRYNFTALQTGLVYISPFIGGLLGTAVAGKVSDYIVKYMTRRNGGIYEPEFRLVMAIPIALATTIGLMAFGWSSEDHDTWIVPTIFFGMVSFGCCLGSTTAITFCVDSYRQYAGEALVTLNFSKNIFHGLVFSLFIVDWLDSAGSRKVYLALGGIQLACLLFSIPMYIYGKRMRMWTVRKHLMENF